MNCSRLARFGLSAVLILLARLCLTQDRIEAYRTGVTLIGSNRCNVVLISGTHKDSPAFKAGLVPGDVLVEVDGKHITTLDMASTLLGSASNAPVTLRVVRENKNLAVTMAREPLATILARENIKIVNGMLYPLDASESEIKYAENTEHAVETARHREIVFPGHYPSNLNLYFGGFEVFLWGDNEITVGGMEDGPAKQAGVRWGDRIIAVDGNNVAGISKSKLESFLSKATPERTQLTIERAGAEHRYSFDLSLASQVMQANGRRLAGGKLIPLWLPEQYLGCFQ